MKLIDYASILSVVLLCSCGKESVEVLPVNEFPDPSDNIEVYNEKIYTQSEFCDFVGNSCSDYVNAYFTAEANNIFKLAVAAAFENDRSAVDRQVAREKKTLELLARSMWSVRKIDYAYWTVSSLGEPIRLSATLVVPVLNNSDVAHTLSAMSLCPPHESNGVAACPTKQGTLLMTRVAFNHAVVVPDYEGRGIAPQLPYSSMSAKVQARQAIDAELAALTILEDMGYSFAEGFGTYNIGVSAGCGIAYYTHYMIENILPQEQQDRINLISSFAADGVMDCGSFIEDYFSGFEYSSEAEEMFIGYMMRFTSIIEGIPESERGGYKAEDLFSHDILNEYGRVDMKHPLIKILKAEVVKNDINFNWEPKHPITLEASYDDTGIAPEHQAMGIYELLCNKQNGMPNRNVKLHMFETPLTVLASEYIGGDYSQLFTHMMADFISFLRGMENLDPSIVND